MAKAVKPKKKETELVVDEVIQTPIVEIEPQVEEPVIVEEPEPDLQEEVAVPEIEVVTEKTMGNKIADFIENKDGTIKLNEFIKSLFPTPKFNEPPIYLTQENSRNIRHVIEEMRLGGKINIVNDLHKRLGEHYYDSQTGAAKRHNLNTVNIYAKK